MSIIELEMVVKPKRQELGALTGLRFLAALFVFIFHIQLQMGTPYLKFRIDNIVSQGALGVNLFFVLSGFLLAYSHIGDFEKYSIDKYKYYRDFMRKRLARIYPAYIVGLLVFLVLTIVLSNYPPPEFFKTLFLDVFMVQALVPNMAMNWYGGGAWSVSVELVFYLLFPVILFKTLEIKKRSTLLFGLLILVVTASVPGLIHNYNPLVLPFTWIYPFAFARVNEFICGIILAVLMYKFNFFFPRLLVYLSLFLFVIYLLFLSNKFTGYTVHNFIAIPVIMGLISFCVKEDKSIFVKWLSSPLMKFLGKISYSFYIMQLPILFVLEYALKRDIITRSDQPIVPLILILNLLLACALYFWIETPFHGLILKKKNLSSRRIL